jgi:hypothetical protein
MIATIVTTEDILRFMWLICSVVFVIPLLAGVLVRILLPQKLATYCLAIVLGFVLSGFKLYLLEITGPDSIRDIDPETIFAFIWAGAFSVVGVRTASAFYSGIRDRTSDRAQQPSDGKPDPVTS